MKFITKIAFACFIISGAVLAQSPVNLIINTQNPGAAIPDDFSGLSIEIGALRSGNGGTNGNMFDDTTTWPANLHLQVITLFKELGLKNVRVGGGSVDMNNIVPTYYDIDAFFRFAKAAGINVIYSFRLLNGNDTDNAIHAKYIWDNYKKYIDCFAIGNEPDWNSYHNQDPEITNYPTYLDKWKRYAAAILDSVADVKFGGPDTGSNYPVPGAKSTYYDGISWTDLFLYDEKNSGVVKSIFLHNYVGQGASGTPQQMIDKMLSTTWVNYYYPVLYNSTCVPILQDGFPYRITESNSFSGYVSGGSNSFASALFGLDYMHWWAAHGAAGVNFHNKQWVGNGPIYMDANKSFQVYPLGYGIKAFDLGGHGRNDSLTINNPDGLNLTAYAAEDTNFLYVTILNKEHGTGERNAKVSIAANDFEDSAVVMYLNVPDGNVADTSGVLLGGAPINNSGPWQGVWSPVDSVNTTGIYVSVPASSAAIVKIKGTITSVLNKPGLPTSFTLSQNYPNPFNPTTIINYSIPKSSFVSLKIYNILGQEVAALVNEQKNAGNYSASFNASILPSGVYIYTLNAGSFTAIKKMMLIK